MHDLFGSMHSMSNIKKLNHANQWLNDSFAKIVCTQLLKIGGMLLQRINY